MSAGSVQPESLTQKWLRQNVQTYAHKDTVYSHVDAVLNRYTTIRPKTDVYSSVLTSWTSYSMKLIIIDISFSI